MSRWPIAALVVMLCAGSAAGGYLLGRPPAEVAEVAPGVPPHEVPAWRVAVEAARATTDGQRLRARALDTINEADGDVALADAVELLGWVGGPEDHDLLVSFARSGDPMLEGPGCEALGRLGTDEAVATLLSWVDDRDLERGVVIASLGNTGHPDALDELVRRLDHPDHTWVAAWALAQFATPRAVHFLARALRDAEPGRAGALARALGSMVDDVPEAAEALHSVLAGPRTPRRSAALTALAEAHDPLVFDLLMADLAGPAPTAAQAARGLGALGDPRAVSELAWQARQAQAEVRMAAIQALSQLDHPDADEALLEMVRTAPPTVAAHAVSALPRVDDDNVLDALLAAMETRGTEVRRAALQRLLGGRWPVGEVPAAVLELARMELRHPTSNTWGIDPVGLLLTHGTVDDADLVEHALIHSPSPQRTAAVWSLQSLGTPAAQALLARLADDSDPGVRQAALGALLELGAEELVEERILAHLAEGKQDYGAAEQMLVRLGTPRAVAAVLERVETGTQREWSSAVSALASSGSRAHCDELLAIADRTEDPQLRGHILQSLSYSETVDLEQVVSRALASDEPRLQATAAYGLARMDSAESREQLLALTRHDEPNVATAALSSLGNLGGPEAEEALIGALDDPDLAWAAVSSLQQVGTPSAREALMTASREADDPQVRASIVQQLAWSGAEGANERLGEALGDDAPEVRSAAIMALQGMGTTQAAELLAGSLASGELSDAEAAQAAMALQNLGGEVATSYEDLIEEHLPDGFGEPMLDTGLALPQ